MVHAVPNIGTRAANEDDSATGAIRPQLAALIAESAAGDREAFGALYRHTAGKLFSVCLGILGSRALAEEALQDAYVNVWRNASSFDVAKGSPMTWLISVARYRSLTLRRRAVREVPADIEAEYARLEDPSPGPLADAVASAEARALKLCLERLEEAPRKAVLLAYYRGLTHDELSRELSVPLGTVKSWIRRSLSRLKLCLDNG
jgi:RNA polymerase sigma-70 factor (ECF subfamily)